MIWIENQVVLKDRLEEDNILKSYFKDKQHAFIVLFMIALKVLLSYKVL